MDALWLTLFPFSPFPGVADPRERTHPVLDRAGGGSRRPFEASGHRGLAPDRAQRAAQRRYGGTSRPPPPPFTAAVSWSRDLEPGCSFPSPGSLGPVNHKPVTVPRKAGTRGSKPSPRPSLLSLLLQGREPGS